MIEILIAWTACVRCVYCLIINSLFIFIEIKTNKGKQY